MEDRRPSSPPTTTAERKPGTAATSRIEKECLACLISLQESFRYVKAKLVGLGKKITARNEKEATAAELETRKKEVEAADEAENMKKRINKSFGLRRMVNQDRKRTLLKGLNEQNQKFRAKMYIL